MKLPWKHMFAIFFSFLSFCALASAASEEWQFFRMNAQYRGIIRHSYRDIGCGLAWFKDLSPDETQMIAHVCAINPDADDEQFSFRINLVIAESNNSYVVAKLFYADFVGIDEERQQEIKQLMSLWKHIRNYCNHPDVLNKAPDVWGKRLELETRHFSRSDRLEITATWPGHRSFSGKFFLERAQNGKWYLDKFRFSGGRVVVSMVQDSREAIMKDFGQFSPYREVVFGN